MKKNRKIYYLIFFLSFLLSKGNDDYVILVSFDGFRWDYTNRVNTPNFDFIEKNGIKAKSLKPIFPSFTFPNHYALATGCYADKHGILGNEFENSLGKYSYKNKQNVRDSKWYKAEPIWVTAEKNNIISATYFWVGSEAKIGGYYPTYFKYYQNGIDPNDKVKQVIEWLELPLDQRPRLVCLYFNEPDHAGHVYGADSKEVNEQIEASDYILGYLINSLKELDIYDNINIVIVSDHGMVDVSEDRVINIDDFDLPGIIEGRGPIMNYKINSDDLYKILDINIPHIHMQSSIQNNQLHYHNSVYDFLLIADEGWMMYSNKDIEKYNGILPVIGMHGYDSNGMNMHAIFYAYGPKFKSGFAIDTFELIHVYPILCELLGIKPYKDIDGNLEVLQSTLK